MAEIAAVSEAIRPCESLLVVDAMTGQEAVAVAQAFAATVPLTGLVLTKIDGDARGGAALSIGAVTGLPVSGISILEIKMVPGAVITTAVSRCRGSAPRRTSPGRSASSLARVNSS